MQTFRKTIHSSVAAIAVAFAAAGTMALIAPVASAQQKTDNKAFADAYTAAKDLIEARKYADAIPKMEQASTLAKSSQERAASAQMRVQVYGTLKRWPDLIKAIEAHKALGGLSASQQRSYKEMLAGAYGQTRQTDKAVELTKELINETGGTATQLAYVAGYALARKQFSEAESYGLKAIQKSSKPDSKHYNIVLAAYLNAGKLDQYYALLEKAAPMFNSPDYWRPFVERAKKEPKFRPNEALLDVYLALEATKVKLDVKEAKEMGEFAVNSSLPIDGERVLAPLVKSGEYGGAKDPQADRNKKYYDRAKSDAAAMKASLAKLEAEAASKQTGDEYVRIGQSYITLGDNQKAIESINKGLAKGGMEPGATEIAKLRLGIAQFNAGQKADARKTWSEVKGDNGAGWLAKVWTAKSRT
jgi:hypothetical protein